MKENPIKFWYKKIKQDVYTFYYAMTDMDTPAHLKVLPILVFIAYLVFPFDLVPDFIPFLGYVDDIILLPLGFALVFRSLPDEILEKSRLKAIEKLKRSSYTFEVILLLLFLFITTVNIGIVMFLVRTF